jgi:hypothetical protein
VKKLKDILNEIKGGKNAFTKDVDPAHIVDGPAKFTKPKVDSEKSAGKNPLATKDVDSAHVVDSPAKAAKPKAVKGDKRDSTYHQKEPVQFKKPESSKAVKADKDQKDVLDRMEGQAKVASDYNPDSEKTTIKESSAVKFRRMINRLNECGYELSKEAEKKSLEEGPHLMEPGYGDERPAGESEAAQQAHNLGLVSKPYGNWADPKTGKVVAKTVQGKLVKIEPTNAAAGEDDDADDFDPEKELASLRKAYPSPAERDDDFDPEKELASLRKAYPSPAERDDDFDPEKELASLRKAHPSPAERDDDFDPEKELASLRKAYPSPAEKELASLRKAYPSPAERDDDFDPEKELASLRKAHPSPYERESTNKEIKASQSALEKAKQLPPEKKAKLIDILKGLSGAQPETDFEDETPVDEKDMADPLFARFKEMYHPQDRTKGRFAQYKHDSENGPSDRGDAWSGGFADNH